MDLILTREAVTYSESVFDSDMRVTIFSCCRKFTPCCTKRLIGPNASACFGRNHPKTFQRQWPQNAKKENNESSKSSKNLAKSFKNVTASEVQLGHPQNGHQGGHLLWAFGHLFDCVGLLGCWKCSPARLLRNIQWFRIQERGFQVISRLLSWNLETYRGPSAGEPGDVSFWCCSAVIGRIDITDPTHKLQTKEEVGPLVVDYPKTRVQQS